MKQECPTYLKATGKSKALIATLSDTEAKIESNDSDDEGILNAFIATVDPSKGIMEVANEEAKFEKMDKQNDIHTAYAKLYKVSERFWKRMRNCIGWPPRS